MAKKLLLALSNLALLAATAAAQDGKTVVQNAAQAMGNVKSIQFSGTGHLSAVGQAWNPTSLWPETIVKSYTKTIDYGAQSAREELVRNEGDPPAKGGAAPFGGDQRQVNLVRGQYAWNQPGNAPQPAIAAAEERQLQIWLTPHGFLRSERDGCAAFCLLGCRIVLHGSFEQTEATHLTEHFRRRNLGLIDLEVTVEDPTAYGARSCPAILYR